MGYTTHGFPAPTNTDLVKDGAQNISDLANAVDDKMGLYFIGQSTTTGSNVCSLTSVFTSTYAAYRVVVSNARATLPVDVAVRMLNGSTPTTTGYYSSMCYPIGTWAAPGGFAFLGQGGGANTYFYTSAVIDNSTSYKAGFAFDIFNPNLATATYMNMMGIDARTTGGGLRSAWGMLNDTTQYTGLQIIAGIAGVQTWSDIRVAVYGYRQN